MSATTPDPNLAVQILELEFEVNASPTPEAVHRLVDLYSNAIEYYACKQDPKHLHFQSRMQELLGNAVALKR